MMAYKRPRWLFFDLDDTLFDFRANSHASLARLWEEDSDLRSVFADAESFLDIFHFHNSRMWDLHEHGLISSEYLKEERFRATAFPYRFDPKALRRSREMNDRYLWMLGQCDVAVPGAIELMEELKGKYLIGMLTNGFTEVQYRKLKSTGLDRYVQRMVISDEIGVQKPDPRIFRYAENAVGASADEIIMVGDNPANDVQGAVDAGWRAVWFDRRDREHDFTGEGYLGRITQLPQLLNFL